MPSLPDRIAAHLQAHTTLVIATARDNQPWIASVFYAPEILNGDVRLTCALLTSSRKLVTLRENPRAAVFIGPREPACWLQAEGIATMIDDEEGRAAALARLLAHAPAAEAFTARVPVVPLILTLNYAKLTDLTGARPPLLEWPTP